MSKIVTDDLLNGEISTLDGTVVHNTGNESVAGIKTFTSIPVLPASNPTTDNQSVRKKYTDDNFVFKELFFPDVIQQIGNTLSLTATSGVRISALSSTRIALFDQIADELRAYDFDGTDWAQVGNSLSISAGVTSITSLSSTRIAFIDGINDQLRAYDFDGTDWNLTGSGLNISGVALTSLTALSSSQIALSDDGLNILRAYSFNGSTWSLVGNSLTISGINDPVISSLSSTRIAFIDETNDQLRAYDFDGTDWNLTGSGLNIGISPGAYSMTSLSSDTIILLNSTTTLFEVFNFSGTAWQKKGNPFNIGVNGAVASMNSNRIAFVDYAASGDLETYQILWTPEFSTPFELF